MANSEGAWWWGWSELVIKNVAKGQRVAKGWSEVTEVDWSVSMEIGQSVVTGGDV